MSRTEYVLRGSAHTGEGKPTLSVNPTLKRNAAILDHTIQWSPAIRATDKLGIKDFFSFKVNFA